MYYIPTVTATLNRKLNKEFLYLMSPTKNNKNKSLLGYTFIIDCHTFYQRLYVNDTISKYNHYKWLLLNLNNIVQPTDIIIMPDFQEVLPEIYHAELMLLWNEFIQKSKNSILGHTENILFDSCPTERIVGYYHYHDRVTKMHNNWNHVFSSMNICNDELINNNNGSIITYDSVYNSKHCEKINIHHEKFNNIRFNTI